MMVVSPFPWHRRGHLSKHLCAGSRLPQDLWWDPCQWSCSKNMGRQTQPLLGSLIDTVACKSSEGRVKYIGKGCFCSVFRTAWPDYHHHIDLPSHTSVLPILGFINILHFLLWRPGNIADLVEYLRSMHNALALVLSIIRRSHGVCLRILLLWRHTMSGETLVIMADNYLGLVYSSGV